MLKRLYKAHGTIILVSLSAPYSKKDSSASNGSTPSCCSFTATSEQDRAAPLAVSQNTKLEVPCSRIVSYLDPESYWHGMGILPNVPDQSRAMKRQWIYSYAMLSVLQWVGIDV